MAVYTLTIELLSDLCVSDGGVYNSSLDIDICQDKYGFPYIPAKRIKGCLRESALELSEWGTEDIHVDALFGKKGKKENAGALQITDAVLPESESCRAEIDAVTSPIYHKQNVLNQYSYVRTQTSVDRMSGTAKPTSLRTMRVAKKGLKFAAKVTCPDTGVAESLQAICTNLRHMGNSRTRGLGEVKLSLEQCGECVHRVKETDYKADAEVLAYTIQLEEPVVSKSLVGGQERTQDYIDGSKLLGVIAGRYRQQNHAEITKLFEEGELIVSNAYIAEAGERYQEVPGYIYGIKNDKGHYVNKLYAGNPSSTGNNAETRQLNAMKHTYIRLDEKGNLHKKDVLTEQRYHHRRPDDKSIGRAKASADADSAFYQISSICPGQIFQGYIKGTADQIRVIYDLLEADAAIRIGYGSSAEYGRCTILSLRTMENREKTWENTKKLLVTLLSPAIIYSEKATASTSVEDLRCEIAAELGLPEEKVSVSSKYIRYTSLGGYNVTWNRRKPVVRAFDKGTALVLDLEDVSSVTVPEHMFIGERITEGYGECRIEPSVCMAAEDRIEKNAGAQFDIVRDDGKTEQIGAHIDLSAAPLASMIADRLFDEHVRKWAVDEAPKLVKGKNLEKYKSTVSNMLLMCRECTVLDSRDSASPGVTQEVKARYNKNSDGKQAKNDVANKILEVVRQAREGVIEAFEKEYRVDNFQYKKGDIGLCMLKLLLQQMKYCLRNNTGAEEKTEGGASI